MRRKSKAEHLSDLKANPNDRRHGTSTGYSYGCRCEACHEAAMEKQRMFRGGLTNKAKKERAAQQKVKDQTKGAAANMWAPLFGKPNASNIYGRCMVCGRPANNHHHIVPRSAGEMSVDGRRLSKPTILLCGNGNTSGCHGLAHQHRLHFRWVDAFEEHRYDKVATPKYDTGSGHYEWKLFDQPINVLEAWAHTKGWNRLGRYS